MPQTLQQFGQTIKAKHPEYADMADEDVAQKVLAKYPEYQDMVTSTPSVAGAGALGTPSIAAHPAANIQPSLLGKDATPTIPTNVARGVVKGGLNTVNGVSSLIHAIPGVGEALVPSSGLQADKLYAQPNGTAQKIGMGAEQAAEFMLPGAAEESAVAKAAQFAPKLAAAAPIAKAGLAALGSGAINSLQGGTFKGGALAGGVGSGVGQGLAAIAPSVAESALKVTGNDKVYGRTVGRAILDDTKGFTPEAVEQSARGTIGKIKPEVEALAASAGADGSRGTLAPAREAVNSIAANHTGNRAVGSAAELQPLQTFLSNDAVTGLPLAEKQTPTGLLRLKRGLDADFIGNWNPNSNSANQLDTARQAYGNLADQFHTAAPGTKVLDQRISSLIPVADRAERASRGAGIVGETLNRFRTPTGALVGAAGGAAEGYHRDGVAGALGGAALGAVLPSVIANPATQMALARGLNSAPVLSPAISGAFLNFMRRSNNKEPEQ